MILFLIGLSTFSIGLSHATSCHSLQQSQLASLNERMNQMINALYPSSFPKAKASGAPYQSTTPAPPTEYSTVASYDPSYYQGYQQISQSPHVVYMSQPHSPTTVAISPPTPGSPPTVTIQTTRVPSPPCYSYDGQEYYQEAPKPYPPQYFEYTYSSQYPPPPPSYPAPPPQYSPPGECPCQQQSEYQQPCGHRQPYPTMTPPAQSEYNQGSCPPAPPCSPPPPYSPGQYPQPPNYTPPSPYAPQSAYPSPPSYPPPGSYPQPSCPPPPPYPTCVPPTYPQNGPQYPQYPQNSPQYPQNGPQCPQNNPQYPPAPIYTNPRDFIQPAQY